MYLFLGRGELLSWVVVNLPILWIDIWCSAMLWLVRSAEFSAWVFEREFPSTVLCTHVEWTVSMCFSWSIWQGFESQGRQYLLHFITTSSNYCACMSWVCSLEITIGFTISCPFLITEESIQTSRSRLSNLSVIQESGPSSLRVEGPDYWITER